MTLLRALRYVAWLVAELVRASLVLARDVLTPGSSMSPAILEVALRCRTDIEVTAYASSITITPGTLVTGVAAARDGQPPTLLVHCLFAADEESVRADLRDMESRLLRVTRGPKGADA